MKAKFYLRKRLPVEDCIVTVANRMFIEDGFKIDRDFKSISKSTLNVTVTPLNFTDGLNASETINSWVRESTNGTIDQLFEPSESIYWFANLKYAGDKWHKLILIPDSFNNETQLVLVNAIYFKSPWKYPFEVENTRKAWFNGNNRNIRVDMMVSEDEFAHGNLIELNAKIVSIPYKVTLEKFPQILPFNSEHDFKLDLQGDRFSMQIIIPAQGSTVLGVLRKLKDVNMDTIRKNLKAPGVCEKVKLHLPKFTIESSHGLVRPIQNVSPHAPFSVVCPKIRDLTLISIPAGSTAYVPGVHGRL